MDASDSQSLSFLEITKDCPHPPDIIGRWNPKYDWFSGHYNTLWSHSLKKSTFVSVKGWMILTWQPQTHSPYGRFSQWADQYAEMLESCQLMKSGSQQTLINSLVVIEEPVFLIFMIPLSLCLPKALRPEILSTRTSKGRVDWRCSGTSCLKPCPSGQGASTFSASRTESRKRWTSISTC